MAATTSGMEVPTKGNVYEMQQPVNGEHSPAEENDMLASYEGEAPQDGADMYRLGRKQQLQRNFHPLSTLGLTCVIMGTWLGMIAGGTFVLIDGGRAGMIWLYIITFIFQVPVIGSMAEMASMAPTSAGQYHWVSEFSSPSVQKYLSYISGWLSALAWQANIAGTAYSSGQFVLILASLNGTFVPKPWHGTLLTIAFALFSACFNIFTAKYLPLFEGAILFFNILGFFAVCIPLWVLAPKASSADVWTSFSNGGDWSTTAAACMIGLLTPAGAFIGADAAAHMSEEVKDASLTVPRVMFFTVFFNGIMGFVSALTYVYSIQDIDTQIVQSTSPFPFIGVFATATNSNAAAIGMTMPWAIIATAGCMNSIAAGSRQAWAFARDDGLPFSPWFRRVRDIGGIPIPINSILASLVICIILSFIQLGSSEAWNTITGLLSGAIGLSYSLSIGCVLWRRLFGAPLPHARWSLGKFGILFNVTGCLFEILVTVMSFFPLSSQFTVAGFNWSSVMFGGIVLLSTIYYLVHGRKVYTGPVVHIKTE